MRTRRRQEPGCVAAIWILTREILLFPATFVTWMLVWLMMLFPMFLVALGVMGDKTFNELSERASPHLQDDGALFRVLRRIVSMSMGVGFLVESVDAWPIFDGLDFDAVWDVDAPSDAASAVDDQLGGPLVPEATGEGAGPLDETYGRPSEVDGDPRVHHYVEEYVRSDGTVVDGHWKSEPGPGDNSGDFDAEPKDDPDVTAPVGSPGLSASAMASSGGALMASTAAFLIFAAVLALAVLATGLHGSDDRDDASEPAAVTESSAAEPPPVNAEDLFSRGYVALSEKRVEKARSLLLDCLMADETHAGCHWELGWIYWLDEDWKRVVKHWERVRQLDPDYPELDEYLPKAHQRLQKSVSAGDRSETPTHPSRVDVTHMARLQAPANPDAVSLALLEARASPKQPGTVNSDVGAAVVETFHSGDCYVVAEVAGGRLRVFGDMTSRDGAEQLNLVVDEPTSEDWEGAMVGCEPACMMGIWLARTPDEARIFLQKTGAEWREVDAANAPCWQ